MIILDTNAISEPLRQNPEPAVLRWLDGQNPNSLYLSAITVRELEFGAYSMAKGKRRDQLQDRIARLHENEFSGRVLAFDKEAALAYGRTVPVARSAGRAVMEADGMIAAIAIANDCAIATRDTSPFKAMGVAEVINPWTEELWKRRDGPNARKTDGAYSYMLAT